MRKKVENWGMVTIQPSNPSYAAPEQFGFAIAGFVDGEAVELLITACDDIHFLSGGIVYELGEPDPVYEEKFPGAKERLQKMFQSV